MRPQAERGSLGDGDNGFHLKGRSEPEQRTAGRPAPGAGSGGCGLGPGRGGLGGRRASGRKAAGGVVWAAGPGAAGGVGAKVTGRSRPRSSRRRPKLKAGRRPPGFLSASRSFEGKKAFPARFELERAAGWCV